MSVWAITMVKDESDVIVPVIQHVAAQGVAGILVADNGSTDGTWQLLGHLHHDLPCDLVVVPDEEVAYHQGRKMSVLAEQAHAWGAEWVWPFDADEVWQDHAGTLVEMIERETAADILEVPLYHHFSTKGDNQKEHNPFKRMTWRDRGAAELPKVIVRWRKGTQLEQGNHGACLPGSSLLRVMHGGMEVRHFPYRSPEQFIKKALNGAAAYRAAGTSIPDHIGSHWRGFGDEFERGGEKALRRVYRENFLRSTDDLVCDPARLGS